MAFRLDILYYKHFIDVSYVRRKPKIKKKVKKSYRLIFEDN